MAFPHVLISLFLEQVSKLLHKFLDCLLIIIIFVVFAKDTEGEVDLVAVFDPEDVQQGEDVAASLLILLPLHDVNNIGYSCDLQPVLHNQVIDVLCHQRNSVL